MWVINVLRAILNWSISFAYRILMYSQFNRLNICIVKIIFAPTNNLFLSFVNYFYWQINNFLLFIALTITIVHIWSIWFDARRANASDKMKNIFSEPGTICGSVCFCATLPALLLLYCIPTLVIILVQLQGSAAIVWPFFQRLRWQ